MPRYHMNKIEREITDKTVLIEIIKKIDAVWAKVRKLELGNSNKEFNTQQSNTVEEEVTDLTSTNKILKLIKELDKGDGVSIENLSLKNINDLDKIIDMLLKEGDVFEIKPGKLKVLE